MNDLVQFFLAMTCIFGLFMLAAALFETKDTGSRFMIGLGLLAFIATVYLMSIGAHQVGFRDGVVAHAKGHAVIDTTRSMTLEVRKIEP